VTVRHVRLKYGNDSQFEIEIDSDRLVATPSAPRPTRQLKTELLDALRRPVDFPSVEQAVIPGDRVTLALDRHTPGAATLVAGIWEVLAPRGLEPEKFVVIQPATLGPARSASRASGGNPGAGPLGFARSVAQGSVRLSGRHCLWRTNLPCPGGRRCRLLDLHRSDRIRPLDGLSRHQQRVLPRAVLGRRHAADARPRSS